MTSCSINKQISKEAKQIIFSDSNFLPAHVGISIYDPATNQYLYNYQGDKYFVPASNMKLFTCYAAMKHLGDSLVGLRYQMLGDTLLKILPSADPTLLHPDFKNQPVLRFFQYNTQKPQVLVWNTNQGVEPLGNGWTWNDYLEDYAAERSSLPVYGNLFRFTVLPISKRTEEKYLNKSFYRVLDITPKFYDTYINYSLQVDEKNADLKFKIIRAKDENEFRIKPVKTSLPQEFYIPISFSFPGLAFDLLADTAKFKYQQPSVYSIIYDKHWNLANLKTIHSQPTDSLLKIMMHRSDNFFAEQSLLMVSNETFGYMSDTKIVDSLLQTDFKSLPQKPKWVDGSGLSRYNLITPQDFVWVLTHMKSDFKWERISTILPTGNEGTLAGYYKNHVGKIYAKTGTLSNNVSLSGYITTQKGKQLIFSILVNNHQTSASNIRRTMEKFLVEVMDEN